MSEVISGDAGRIGFLLKGDYNADATYDFLDVVHYNGSSYVAKKETTGNIPVYDNEFWHIFASGAQGGDSGDTTDYEDLSNKPSLNGVELSGNKSLSEIGIGIMNLEKVGLGKPDGTTITVDEDGTMHSGGGSEGNFASRAIYGDDSISLGRAEESVVGGKSIVFGVNLDVSGKKSMSIGEENVVSGINSFSGGYHNKISGNNAFSIGNYNELIGVNSFSNGYGNKTIGINSTTLGSNNVSVDSHSFSEGCGNAVLGYGSHAENSQNIAGAEHVFKIESYDSSEKKFTFDDTFDGFSDAWSALKSGSSLHIANTYYIGESSIYTVELIETDGKSVYVKEAIPESNFDVLYATMIKVDGNYSACHVEGMRNIAMGWYSHVEGRENIAMDYGHSEGYHTKSLFNQHSQGHYNDVSLATATSSVSGASSGTAFVIGNGTSSTQSNAARIDYNGKLWCKSAYSSTGADYAELFEWSDGNPDGEDRRGYFVTMEGKKIRKASEGDYILGIVSGNPCIIGNTDMEWYGQFMRDEFGSFIKETYKEIVSDMDFDENRNWIEVEKEVEVEFYKVNPDYDPNVPYTFRLDRPEWDAVGMLGVLPVRDDGTCEVGRYCKCTGGGIATLATQRGFDTYMVTERVAENIVSVILK